MFTLKRALLVAVLLSACAADERESVEGAAGALPSDGAPCSNPGQKETRTRYLAPASSPGQACIREEQQRACEAGQWSGWSGRFAHDSCTSAAPPKPRGSLGSNLGGIAYYSTDVPFVDVFRASGQWISGNTNGTWDDGQPLDLDGNGWVKSLRANQIARTPFLWGFDGAYPGGTYVVLYDGEGAIQYAGDAKRDDAASTPGRDVISLTPGAGALLAITATNPQNYLRNIRVVPSGGVCSNDAALACTNATECAGGGDCLSFEATYATRPFHPDFLKRIKDYQMLRFMDWMDTNNSHQVTWSDRPNMADARWTSRGVPVEMIVSLANTLLVDPWFSLPHQADDNYVREFATYVRDHLDKNLKAYVEYSNEVWNGQFQQATYARTQGIALNLGPTDFESQLRFYSRRATEVLKIWESVFNDGSRLVRVLASQSGNPWAGDQVLNYGDSRAHADALAIAPYFGGSYGAAGELNRVKGLSVDQFLDELQNVELPRIVTEIDNNAKVAAAYGVDLVAYEGGQHLTGIEGAENDAALNALFDAVNRHPRMGQIYTTYLNGWRTKGGKLFGHFLNCGAYTKWGRWGALEHMWQPREQAPKYDAVMTFNDNVAQWW
jgi:hypothetical protein